MKLKQVIIAIERLINTLANGWSDETLSARAFRNADKRKSWYYFMRFIDFIFFWQKCHCYCSWVNEIERKNLPSSYSIENK
jgi:hypothetical protein